MHAEIPAWSHLTLLEVLAVKHKGCQPRLRLSAGHAAWPGSAQLPAVERKVDNAQYQESEHRPRSSEGAGVASSIGLGLHKTSDSPDELGRYLWMVTHLNTGLAICKVRGRDADMAGTVANVLEGACSTGRP
jgi:hypothetical protein